MLVILKPSIDRTRRLMRRWVLFDPVIQVFTLANADRLQPAPGGILQAICGVAGNDRLVVGLATIDDDAIRSPMTLQRLSEEAFGRGQVALLAEIEFDCVADPVDGAVKIHPLAADLDVRLVDMPLPGHATLALVEARSNKDEKRTVQRWMVV